MTQEEKAKAYDEALERARKIHNEIINNEIIGFPGQIIEIFPQLRESESEDERIRKWLIDYFSSIKATVWIHRDITCEQILGWLEKQKEQKPELVQQPPITYTYNSNASRDERLKAALLALLNSDLLKVKEGGYFTKQDLIEWVERIPTDKPAEWSEEDENKIESIKGLITMGRFADTNTIRTIWELLDSLRPSWKPSEEQMKQLHYALTPGSAFDCDILNELYIQLKKLK